MYSNIDLIIGDLNALSVVYIPIVMAMTEMFKSTGVPNRFLPVINVLNGLFVIVLINGINTLSILTGILLGLSAGGLYRGIKVVQGK